MNTHTNTHTEREKYPQKKLYFKISLTYLTFFLPSHRIANNVTMPAGVLGKGALCVPPTAVTRPVNLLSCIIFLDPEATIPTTE